jgi:hypothetical protein
MGTVSLRPSISVTERVPLAAEELVVGVMAIVGVGTTVVVAVGAEVAVGVGDVV